jgi:hypothetical protein
MRTVNSSARTRSLGRVSLLNTAYAIPTRSEPIMHTAKLTLKTLECLWGNYWLLGRQVDPYRMPSDRIDELIRQKAPADPLLLAAWLATQGFFISAWSLWEYYSRSLCNGLPNKVSEKGKSHVQWVAETFGANGKVFAEHNWFVGGNALRNLIAHHAARAVGSDAEKWWKKAQPVFPDLQLDPDGYILINHDHASTLKWKVDEFIRDPSRRAD